MSKRLNILLVVGTANDIFIYNMAKWLKKSMNVNIDVFEFYPSHKQGYDNRYYDNLVSVDNNNFLLKIRGVRTLIKPYIESKQLKTYLLNKHYDIIQCHWIVPGLVLTDTLKEHCNKLCVTFWGGELTKLSLLYSHKYYLNKLKRFISSVDCIINSHFFHNKLKSFAPDLNITFHDAALGSSSIEELYKLNDIEIKNKSKQYWNIPLDKTSVLIGYSGKSLHNHIPIIEELTKRNDYEKRIHLLAPMTRGASENYITEVENALKKSGFSYTLIKDRFLSDLEVARLRRSTDITLQLSDFDGYSRSIVECLCAGSILIYGDWLNYKDRLNDDGFSAYSVSSIEKAVLVMEEVIRGSQINITNENLYKGRKYLWSECIKDWVNIYSEND